MVPTIGFMAVWLDEFLASTSMMLGGSKLLLFRHVW
jgi:hypothetical protein